MQALPTGPAGPIRLLTLLRLLRLAGTALLEQTSLHAQLLAVEWAREKQRLLAMLLVILLGYACLLAMLLVGSGVILALAWETDYRIPAALSLLVLYAVGMALAWWRFNCLSARAESMFAGTRNELAADLAVLRSAL